MPATRSTQFDVRGINHLALVVNDMAETMRFYKEVLGCPLVRSQELADGGQQAFFAISDETVISTVWYPDAPEADLGLVYSPFGGVDDRTGQHKGRHRESALGGGPFVFHPIPKPKSENEYHHHPIRLAPISRRRLRQNLSSRD